MTKHAKANLYKGDLEHHIAFDRLNAYLCGVIRYLPAEELDRITKRNGLQSSLKELGL